MHCQGRARLCGGRTWGRAGLGGGHKPAAPPVVVGCCHKGTQSVSCPSCRARPCVTGPAVPCCCGRRRTESGHRGGGRQRRRQGSPCCCQRPQSCQGRLRHVNVVHCCRNAPGGLRTGGKLSKQPAAWRRADHKLGTGAEQPQTVSFSRTGSKATTRADATCSAGSRGCCHLVSCWARHA